MLVSGLGLGALYLIWRSAIHPRPTRNISKHLTGKARNFDDCVSEIQHTAAHCGREASATVKAAGAAIHQSRDCLASGLAQTKRAVRDLQKLIHHEPSTAIAGGLAMVLGLALLWRNP
ncbi:MAG: hypothetical protein JWM59_3060 [Verrucomicrobiales bacterium]|nr:hypothetical protein [Verrucomicrobiales bacterium]